MPGPHQGKGGGGSRPAVPFLVDEGPLETLRHALGPAEFGRLLVGRLQEMASTVAGLRSAWDGGFPDRVRQHAQQMGDLLGGMGALGLMAMAHRLAAAAAGDEPETARYLLPALEHAHVQLDRALRRRYGPELADALEGP